MLLLSGDHATSLSAALVLVMRRGAFSPSADTSPRSLTLLSVSYEGSTTEYTTHLPSGLTAGAPTRFIIHSASCVMVLGGGAASAIDWSAPQRNATISIAQHFGEF